MRRNIDQLSLRTHNSPIVTYAYGPEPCFTKNLTTNRNRILYFNIELRLRFIVRFFVKRGPALIKVLMHHNPSVDELKPNNAFVSLSKEVSIFVL